VAAKRKSIKGIKFHSLLVLEDPPKNSTKCLCRCDCGKERPVNIYLLKSGKTKSCGCKTLELRKQSNRDKFGVEFPTQDADKMKQIQQTNMERYGTKAPAQNKAVHDKMKKTCLERYGVKNTYQSEEIKTKIRKKNMENLGVPYPTQSPEVMEKQRATVKERYGVDYVGQSDGVKAKISGTCLEKYGVPFAGQAEEVRVKIKESLLKRYGVDNAFQAEEVKIKIKKTCLARYGVENAYQSEEVQAKVRQTNMEKFGVPFPTQSPEVIEKQRETFLRRYGVDNYFKSEEYLKLANSGSFFTSKGERQLNDFIQSLGCEAKKMRKGGNEIDIYIDSAKIGIEYNGLYWHSEAKLPRDYHLEKTLFFKTQGIKLIQVFEHEWQQRQEQVKSRFRSIFGLNEHKVGARKCKIVQVDKKTTTDIVENTHIQGSAHFDTAFGLEYDNQIVAVATFVKHHRNSSQIVLNRFCCLDGYTIQGGLARLSKYASNHFKQDIISWCDLRWSDGNGYVKAGWVEDAILKPDYFYFKNNQIISKQSRKKSTAKTPSGVTEREHAILDGLLRVYDCGKIRYVYKHLDSSTKDQ